MWRVASATNARRLSRAVSGSVRPAPANSVLAAAIQQQPDDARDRVQQRPVVGAPGGLVEPAPNDQPEPLAYAVAADCDGDRPPARLLRQCRLANLGLPQQRTRCGVGGADEAGPVNNQRGIRNRSGRGTNDRGTIGAERLHDGVEAGSYHLRRLRFPAQVLKEAWQRRPGAGFRRTLALPGHGSTRLSTAWCIPNYPAESLRHN